MKDSRYYFLIGMLCIILQHLMEGAFITTAYGIVGIALFICSIVYGRKERKVEIDEFTRIDVAVEGDDETGYSLYTRHKNLSVIGEGDTIGEALSDFINSWSEMQQLYKEQGREFPDNVNFNFSKI